MNEVIRDLTADQILQRLRETTLDISASTTAQCYITPGTHTYVVWVIEIWRPWCQTIIGGTHNILVSTGLTFKTRVSTRAFRKLYPMHKVSIHSVPWPPGTIAPMPGHEHKAYRAVVHNIRDSDSVQVLTDSLLVLKALIDV